MEAFQSESMRFLESDSTLAYHRIMYIDTHAHLFFEDFQQDLAAVLARAIEAGVRQIVVPGTDVATSRQAIALAEEHDGIFACVGIHPHEAAKCSNDDIELIRGMTQHEKVVAVGEIGLDFYYDFAPRDRQGEVLKRQLEIAVEANLPVVIHTRESLAETMAAVEAQVQQHPDWRNERGVFHCFPGTAQDARRLRELGFFVSYPGIVTFKKSDAMSVVREFGFENILLETDSPYLAPVPLRGKRNEPANVPLIARHIAAQCGVEESVVEQVTTNNAQRLFQLGNAPLLEERS